MELVKKYLNKEKLVSEDYERLIDDLNKKYGKVPEYYIVLKPRSEFNKKYKDRDYNYIITDLGKFKYRDEINKLNSLMYSEKNKKKKCTLKSLDSIIAEYNKTVDIYNDRKYKSGLRNKYTDRRTKYIYDYNHINKDDIVKCGEIEYGKKINKIYKKNTKITRGKEGIFIHHIREDEHIDLSKIENINVSFWHNYSKDNMTNEQFIEYTQSPDSLVYCNLLEHILLHLLIIIKDHSREKEDMRIGVGIGGIINHLLLDLNNLYGWYEFKQEYRKDYLEKIDYGVYMDLLFSIKKYVPSKMWLFDSSNTDPFDYTVLEYYIQMLIKYDDLVAEYDEALKYEDRDSEMFRKYIDIPIEDMVEVVRSNEGKDTLYEKLLNVDINNILSKNSVNMNHLKSFVLEGSKMNSVNMKLLKFFVLEGSKMDEYYNSLKETESKHSFLNLCLFYKMHLLNTYIIYTPLLIQDIYTKEVEDRNKLLDKIVKDRIKLKNLLINNFNEEFVSEDNNKIYLMVEYLKNKYPDNISLWNNLIQ